MINSRRLALVVMVLGLLATVAPPTQASLMQTGAVDGPDQAVNEFYRCRYIRSSAAVTMITALFPPDQLKAVIGPEPYSPRIEQGATSNGTQVIAVKTLAESEGGLVSHTLSVYPQVSVIAGFLDINGTKYPEINTREEQTTVRIRDKETLVIGGLLREDEITKLTAVPGLSKLPFFGELFKHRSRSHIKSDLVITITPEITKDDEDSEDSNK